MTVWSLQAWSDLACASGVRLGPVEYESFVYGAALDNTQGCTLTVRQDDTATLALLAMANVLRVNNEIGQTFEYLINNLQYDLSKPVATILGNPVESLLGHAMIRAVDALRDSTRAAVTLSRSDWIALYVLPSLALYGQTFWSLGQIDPTGTYTASFVDQLCLWLVRQLLLNQTAALQARRIGETGYALDLVNLAPAIKPRAVVGDNVLALAWQIDDREQANSIIVAGQTFSGNDEPERLWYTPFRTARLAGTVLTLDDPSGLGTTILGSNRQPFISTDNVATAGLDWRLGCITQPFAFGTINGITSYLLYRAVYIQSTKVVWCCFGVGGSAPRLQSVNLETRVVGTNQTTNLTTPFDAYYYSATDTLYVVDNGGNRVTPYTTAGPTAGTPIAVGTGPRRIMYITAGSLNRLLIGHTGSNAVLQINPATNAVTATSPAMTTPAHLDSVSDTQVYVASNTVDAVYRYNATANTLTTTITNSATGGYTSLVVLPTVSEVWACQTTTGTVPPVTKITIISTTTDTVKLTLDTSATHQAVLDCVTVGGNYYGVTQDGLLVAYSGTTHALLFAWRHAAWVIGAPLRSIEYLSDIDCFQIGADTGTLYHVDAQTGGAMIGRDLTAAAASLGGPNLCLQSQTLNANPWQNASDGTNTGDGVTANTTIAPDGTLTADTITITATASGRAQTVGFTSDGSKVVSMSLKQGTLSTTNIYLLDSTLGTPDFSASVSWVAGVPTVTPGAGSGSVFAPIDKNNGWYQIAILVNGVIAAHSNTVYVQPQITVGNSIIVWGVQAEDALEPSTYVATTTVVAGGPTVTLANSIFPIRQFDEVVFCRDDGDPLFEVPNSASIATYGIKQRVVPDATGNGGSNRVLNGGLTWYDSSRSVARFLNLTHKGASSEAKWDSYPDPTVLSFTCAANGIQAIAAYAPASLNFKTAGAGRVFLPGDLLTGTISIMVLAKATADGSGNVALYVATSSTGVTDGQVFTVTRPNSTTLLTAGVTSAVALPQVANSVDDGTDCRSRLSADVNLPFIPGEMTNLYWGMNAWTQSAGTPNDWRLRILSLDQHATLLDVNPNPNTVSLPGQLVPMSFAGSVPLPTRFAGGHMQMNLQLPPSVVGPLLGTLYVTKLWVQVGNADRGVPGTDIWRLWQLGQDSATARGDPLVSYTVQPMENDPLNPFELGATVTLRDAAHSIQATPRVVNIQRTLPKSADDIVRPVIMLDNRTPSFVDQVARAGGF